MASTESFEITFRGTAGPAICQAFEEYAVNSNHGRTTVQGRIRDQADLQGVLDRMFSLGLEVLDVHVGGTRGATDG